MMFRKTMKVSRRLPKNGKTATDIVDVATLRENIATYLAGKLNLQKADIEKAFDADGRYYILQTQVEKNVADEIENYFDNSNLVSFATEATTRRYYPQEELAASVIGFTNGDGDGQYGLEYQQNNYLARRRWQYCLLQQAANGEEMPYRYSTTCRSAKRLFSDLTLDTTMKQYHPEKGKSVSMAVKFNVQQRACGIIMNPKTGAIYAMATYPSFDLNNPSDIYDTATSRALDSLSGQEYSDAYLAARETQWKNKAISEIYYPGSVFKVFTSAAAFEENLIDLPETIRSIVTVTSLLWARKSDVPTEAVTEHKPLHRHLRNSCNPAFMEIGLRLGVEKFSYYFKGFGLTEKTGIDLPGEVASCIFRKIPCPMLTWHPLRLVRQIRLHQFK